MRMLSACNASGGSMFGSTSGHVGSSNGLSLRGRSSTAPRRSSASSRSVRPSSGRNAGSSVTRPASNTIRPIAQLRLRRGHAIRIALARHREMHAMQGHRPGHGAVRPLPGQFGAGRQPRHDLLQQQVAPADRHQQRVRQHGDDDHDGQGADAAAHRDLALALAPQRAQFGDARVALCLGCVGRQRWQPVLAKTLVARAQAHRLAPMLRCRVNGESGESRPCAMSIAHRPHRRTPAQADADAGVQVRTSCRRTRCRCRRTPPRPTGP